jgi:hypothetical protein
MLMNAYDLTVLLALLHRRGCEDAFCKFIDQGRYPGAIVIARVPGPPSPRSGARSAAE